jgi:hypothetical protein
MHQKIHDLNSQLVTDLNVREPCGNQQQNYIILIIRKKYAQCIISLCLASNNFTRLLIFIYLISNF